MIASDTAARAEGRAEESERGSAKCKTMPKERWGWGGGGGGCFVCDRRRHDKPSFTLMAKRLSVARAKPQRLSER